MTCMISEIMFIMQRLFILVRSSIELSPVRPYIYMYNLKDGSLWLQPPRTRCGGVRKNSAFSHLIRRLGPVKEVVA